MTLFGIGLSVCHDGAAAAQTVTAPFSVPASDHPLVRQSLRCTDRTRSPWAALSRCAAVMERETKRLEPLTSVLDACTWTNALGVSATVPEEIFTFSIATTRLAES
jgi:hypothetical protein